MLRGGQVKEIYELNGQGYSAREIARTLGLARNAVLRYLKDPEAIVPKARALRGSVKGGEKVGYRGGENMYHRHDEKELNWEPGGVR